MPSEYGKAPTSYASALELARNNIKYANFGLSEDQITQVERISRALLQCEELLKEAEEIIADYVIPKKHSTLNYNDVVDKWLARRKEQVSK